MDICQKATSHARKLKCDTIIYDTAGRLAIDETLMTELSEVKEKTKPQNIFLVVDAMIGQDAVKTAAAFHDRLAITGVVLTKLDGTARGGALIGVWEKFHIPIKLIGVGEGVDDLRDFDSADFAEQMFV